MFRRSALCYVSKKCDNGGYVSKKCAHKEKARGKDRERLEGMTDVFV